MKAVAFFSSLALPLLGEACLLPEELHDPVPAPHRLVPRQSDNTGIGVGKGDRFAGGSIVPRGAGTQEPGTDMGLLLNVEEIHSAVKALVDEYGIEYFEAPETTYEGNPIFGARAGGTPNCTSSYHVYFNAAVHARERGAPDNIIYFMADLLYANKHNTNLRYGGRTYSNCDVRRALATGIVFTPLANPDGVAWDQETNTCWRKNRNATSAVDGDPATIGVDVNRNFDFLFDYLDRFHPDVGPNLASKDPAAQTFQGLSAFSEAESRAVKWVMDTHPSLGWFMDIHSYTGVLLYAWGSDENQIRKPYMNFLNSTYDKVRGLLPDDPDAGDVYGEYIPSRDWADKAYAAERSKMAMHAATGRYYDSYPAALLYPTSGASDDYAYARHFVDPSLSKIHGYCLEFGFGNAQVPACPFYPTPEQYHQHLLETNSGFMEFLLAASEIGLGPEATC